MYMYIKQKQNKYIIMETTIIEATIIVITLVVIIVSAAIRRQKPTDKQLQKLQQSLDKSDAQANERFGLDWHHDALEEYQKDKTHISGFVSLLTGLCLAALFMVSVLFLPLEMTTIIMICISAMILMVNGLVIFAEHKLIAILTLIIVLGISILTLYKIESIMTYDPSLVYRYLCGIILFAGFGLWVTRK